jgi:hypothetical protein
MLAVGRAQKAEVGGRRPEVGGPKRESGRADTPARLGTTGHDWKPMKKEECRMKKGREAEVGNQKPEGYPPSANRVE